MGTFNVTATVTFRVEARSHEEARLLADGKMKRAGADCGVRLHVAAASAEALEVGEWKEALSKHGVTVRECEVDKGRWRWRRLGPAVFESETDAVKAAAIEAGLLDPEGACDSMMMSGRTVKEWKEWLKDHSHIEVYPSDLEPGQWGFTGSEDDSFATEFEALHEALVIAGPLMPEPPI